MRVPTEAQRMADGGDLIGAIKVTRQVPGLGLQQARIGAAIMLARLLR